MEEAISLRVKASRVQSPAFDRTAFEEFYAQYLPKIYNYVCYRVGDERIAEDITADVFERALTRLHTYQSDRGAFSTWLFSIAHNQVANYLRSRSRRPDVCSLDAVPSVAVEDAAPEQAAIQAEQLRQVRAGMRQLPEQQQEILALKFGLGLSNQEIAKVMRLNPNHIGVLLHRAVRTLRSVVGTKEMTE